MAMVSFAIAPNPRPSTSPGAPGGSGGGPCGPRGDPERTRGPKQRFMSCHTMSLSSIVVETDGWHLGGTLEDGRGCHVLCL
eukprot:4638282-Pyramimonas_sp.AAC.1